MARYTVAVLVCLLAASAGPQSLHAQSPESLADSSTDSSPRSSRTRGSVTGARKYKRSNATRRTAEKYQQRRVRRAKRHLRRGLRYYEQRRFERAIAEFSRGYDIHPLPEFLFALGQSERRSGDCASARVYYQRFLATSPPARQVTAANMHVEGCRRALQDGPGSARDNPAPRPEPVQPVQSVYIPPVADTAPAPWYHDWLGDSLLAVGTASVATGVILVVKSRSDTDQAGWVATYPEYDTAVNSARRSRLLGIVSLAAGTALVAGAAYRFHRSRRDTERLALVPDIQPLKGGIAVGLGGRF